MPAKKKSTIPDSVLHAYDEMIAGLDGVDRKGATMPYTSVNGHMFSFLDPEGKLSLRLSQESREAFMARHDAKLAEQHGTVLKEYVVIPDELFSDVGRMKKYFQESYDHVRSLKPKTSARK